jgi:periplasmic divalent cation tolerance protein
MANCLVYMTAASKEEARAIGTALVEERLAACANVIGGMISIYRWEGKVQHDDEAVLIAKTREELVPALTEKVKALHSYACPCVVALPIAGGNGEFLDWIAAETG